MERNLLMLEERTAHALSLEPTESLGLAVGYIRILDYYNIHADNLTAFVSSLPQVSEEVFEEFSLQGTVYHEILRSGDEEAATHKVDDLFALIARQGLSPAELNALSLLFDLFVEYSRALQEAETEALIDAGAVSLRPSQTLKGNAEYVKALQNVNLKAANLFFFMVGEEDLAGEVKDQIAFCINEYYRAIRSWVFAEIFITKGDLYSLGATVSEMDKDAMWALKDHLDAYAEAALELEEAENKAFDALPDTAKVWTKPWQS